MMDFPVCFNGKQWMAGENEFLFQNGQAGVIHWKTCCLHVQLQLSSSAVVKTCQTYAPESEAT